MKFPRVPLEDWMRQFYFDTPIDMGSSGVENYSLAEIRELTGLQMQSLDNLVFNDSLTLGDNDLRAALADRLLDGDPQKVMVTNGSNEAGFFISQALLEPGDEVVCLDPIYHTLCNLPDANGCHVKSWPLRWERGFEPDFTELNDLVTDKTAMICVNFPHNPTGTSINESQLDELIAIADRVDAWLVWDAAFQELVYDREQLPNPLLRYPKSLVTGTLSKCYGLAGSRVGWVMAMPHVLEKFELIKDYLSLFTSPLVELVATSVIRHADKLVAPRHARAASNLKLLETWIEARSARFSWIKPQGGVTAFPKIHDLPNSEPFCKDLAREHGVMMVPGTCFKHPSHVRLGFAGPTDSFELGLSRLDTFLESRFMDAQLLSTQT